MLLKMLLEPSLPVTNLLNSRDEVLLREVMYDVAILVDYSFLKPEIWTRVPGDHFKKFSLTWLLVADNAVQFIRDCCDHTRAISYIDVFSKSGVPYQLIKWVTDQTGLEENIIRPNVSTPKALIRWLLALENRGIRVFDHNVSSLHAKAVICKSKIDHAISEARSNCRNPNGSVLFGIDKVDDDQEMIDWLCTMHLFLLIA
ncbi:hypothetical protein Acr_25g0006440 [Actinidia rufa]|uniref:Uncharacterized protein n=1 Tax=Actinidia rufa TaxID=165716 RepID=A0A7J0GZG7_9ERIC|nr:hypothetical protein Acr_25g0006440 [Actinidia rufa]